MGGCDKMKKPWKLPGFLLRPEADSGKVKETARPPGDLAGRI